MWGSAFAVCVMQGSLTCPFEHSDESTKDETVLSTDCVHSVMY